MKPRHIRAAGVVALAIAASVALGSGLGGAAASPAQEGDPLPLSIAPETGPPGTEIFVSSTDCFESTVQMVLADDEENTLDSVAASPDEDGVWGDVVTVPNDASLVDGQELTVSAECIADDSEGDSEGEAESLQRVAPAQAQATHPGYRTRTFRVAIRQPPVSTTTTTTTTEPTNGTTATTTRPTPTTLPTAPPAGSRVAQPTFTG
jgi:hypothetical protein